MAITPNGVLDVITAAGDDPTLGIGKGEAFLSVSNDVTPTLHVTQWQFSDVCFFLTTTVQVTGGMPGDLFDYVLHAPATPTGSGLQPVSLEVTEGGNRIVPDAGGVVFIDLANAVPVRNVTGQGGWDWDFPDTGYGIVSPNYAGIGQFDLFDFSKDVASLLTAVNIIGAFRMVTNINANPTLILPHWANRVTVKNIGHAGLVVNWTCAIGRVRTV